MTAKKSKESSTETKSKTAAVTVDKTTESNSSPEPESTTKPEEKAEPTYGDLKKKIEQLEVIQVRLENAVTEAGDATAKQAERAERAEGKIRTIRQKASKDKEKILERLRGLEGASAFPIQFWERFQSSKLADYLDKDLKPLADKFPGALSRDGDWLAPLIHAYRQQLKGKQTAAVEAIFERHADLDEKPPKGCVCAACKLRAFIREQKEILVTQESEIRRLTREVENLRGKKTHNKKIRGKGKGGRR